MIYVITGATSFIGIELAKYLVGKGNDIIAVCRPNSNGLKDLPKEVDVIFLDMADYSSLDEKIKKADVFINLAWMGTSHGKRDDASIQKDNIRFSLAAMEAAKKMGCKLFVESGSQAEYGITQNVQNEDMLCNPLTEYGKAKLIVKEKGFELAEKIGIKYAHLRIFSLFGENDHPWTLVMSSIHKMLKDETVDLTLCNQNWNFLYVKDAVLQICALCDYAVDSSDYIHEVYNIASEDTRKLKDFVEEIKQLTHSTSKLEYGAIKAENVVSLQPSISKLKKDIGSIKFHQFSDVILKIKQNIDDSKVDIFEKIDNFKTYADVKSNLGYGDFKACPNPLISVIIPVYNRPDMFKDTLLSVLNQDCTFPYEIIVVDNYDGEGKSPNLDVVEQHAASNLFYYRHEKNIGGYGNLNRGVELARAEYISFCHDDDQFMPHALRIIWDLHLKHKNKCITSKFILMNEDGTVPEAGEFPSKIRKWGLRFYDRKSYSVSLFDQFIWPSGLDICNLYKRSCFIELGGYNPSHHPSCDNALLASYTYYYGALFNNMPSFKYRIGDNASQTLWPLFAENHLHQRKCMAKKIHLPHFLLKKIYMAIYRKDVVQHRVFWGHEPSSLWETVPKKDLKLIRKIDKLLSFKKYYLRLIRKKAQYYS